VPTTDPPGDVEGRFAGEYGLRGIEAGGIRKSSPAEEGVPCFVALAVSEPGVNSEDTPKGTLFKSTNRKAGSLEGLWSRR